MRHRRVQAVLAGGSVVSEHSASEDVTLTLSSGHQ